MVTALLFRFEAVQIGKLGNSGGIEQVANLRRRLVDLFKGVFRIKIPRRAVFWSGDIFADDSNVTCPTANSVNEESQEGRFDPPSHDAAAQQKSIDSPIFLGIVSGRRNRECESHQAMTSEPIGNGNCDSDSPGFEKAPQFVGGVATGCEVELVGPAEQLKDAAKLGRLRIQKLMGDDRIETPEKIFRVLKRST